MGDVKISIGEVIEVRDGGLDAHELLALTVLAAEKLPPLKIGELFDIDQVFIRKDGAIEIETVAAAKVAKEYEPPEWSNGECDEIAAAVYCWGAVLKQAGSELIAEAELFSLVNILSVAIIGTRPTPTRMAQMAKNQLRGRDAREIVQDMYLEVMGDDNENQLSDDYSEKDFEIDAPPRSKRNSQMLSDDELSSIPEPIREPIIIVEDLSEPSVSTSHNSVKKAVVSANYVDEYDDALSGESSEDEPVPPPRKHRQNPFDDDFGKANIKPSPNIDRKGVNDTLRSDSSKENHSINNNITKSPDPANPFDDDEEDEPFNQSTLSGRDPFEHLKSKIESSAHPNQSEVDSSKTTAIEISVSKENQNNLHQKLQHKFSEDDGIVEMRLSDEEFGHSSVRSQKERYFDEVVREVYEEDRQLAKPPQVKAVIEEEARTPSTSFSSSMSALSSDREEAPARSESSRNVGSPEPQKRISAVKKAIEEPQHTTSGIFKKKRPQRRTTNPFDDDIDGDSSSELSSEDEPPRLRNGGKRVSDMVPPKTPTPTIERRAPPPKAVHSESDEAENMDAIFEAERVKRRESKQPVIIPDGAVIGSQLRDSPQVDRTPFVRQNSLTPNRISRRSTQQRRGKTRAEPEFVDKKTQPAIRLKAPSTKKKKMVLHRVEQTEVFVELLNGQRIEVSCRSDVLAADVFSLVVGHMNINEHVFFGLSVVRDGEHFFLDDDQRLEKFAPAGWKDHNRRLEGSYHLHLRFRFYPQILDFIKTDVTLHELFLQLRRDILEDRLQPKREKALELAALALQAEFGDRPPPAVKDYFAMEFYLQRRFYQFDDPLTVQTQIGELHGTHKGTRVKDAEIKYIQVCTTLVDYGSHLHRVFRSKPSAAHGASPFDPDTGANMWIGIMPRGIVVLEEQGGVRHALAEHPWHRTQTLQFDKKRFVIVAAREGDYTETVFWTDHYSNNHYAWAGPVEYKSAYFVRFAASQHRFMMRMRQWKNTLRNERTISALPDVGVEDSLPRTPQQRDAARSDSIFDDVDSLFPKVSPRSPASPKDDENESFDFSKQRTSVERVESERKPVPPPGNIFTVTLHKDPSSGLGLTLVDGKLNEIAGVYVKSVAPEGAGEKSGLLVGDRLLAVNGLSLIGADRHKAVELVKSSGPTVRIEVSRLEGVAAHARQISADSVQSKKPPAPKLMSTAEKSHTLDASVPASTKAVSRTPPVPRKQPNKRIRAVSDFGAIGDMLPVLNSDDIIADKMRAISGLHLDESDEEKGEYRLPQHSLYSFDQTDEDTLGPGTKVQKRRSDSFGSEPRTVISPARDAKKYAHQRRSNLDWAEEIDEEFEHGEIIHVQLERNEENSLGIQIASQSGRVCIKQVTAEPGLSADVRAGDVLLAVDGESAVNRTHQEVVNMLRSAGHIVKLTLKREDDVDDSSEEERTISVTLQKPDGGSLGFSLAKRTGFDGIFIRKIEMNSAAFIDNTLRVGDRMWAIDGESVGSSSPAALVERLKRVQGPVQITVKRPRE